MKILEHTSTQLTLKDSILMIWIARLIGSVFLIFGCLGFFILFEEIILSILNGEILSNLQSLFFITFCIVIGIAIVFFSSVNTFYFDKNLKKLIIKYERILRKKVVEYPLDDIRAVVVEKKYSSKTNQYQFFIALIIASNSRNIRLSNTSYLRLRKAEERADLIRSFLDIS